MAKKKAQKKKVAKKPQKPSKPYHCTYNGGSRDGEVRIEPKFQNKKVGWRFEILQPKGAQRTKSAKRTLDGQKSDVYEVTSITEKPTLFDVQVKFVKEVM